MKLRALDRKLYRDLWRMRGIVLAIALVLTGGVATFVMSLSTYESLELTRTAYYMDQRFAEVFASLKRAPETLSERIREIPGVDQVETRVVAVVSLDIEGFGDPATGALVSLPDYGEPVLNRPYLRRGRLIEPRARSEVLISEEFADAHAFKPGDTLAAIINGRRKKLNIVGVAQSPEYIYPIGPGAFFPDHERFGILWMGRKALATAYDMEGAFNDVSMTLQANASLEDVLEQLDVLLDRYGGRGGYGRKDQFSHRFLTEELRMLQTTATVFPVIFLGVAAFLLNVVISRLLSTEREQVAILKAFGYSNLQIGLHYTKLVLLITLLGLGGGLFVGVWFGKGLGVVYSGFYSFPFFYYRLNPQIVVNAALVSVVAGLAGTVFAVRKAARLPPAEGMRPEPPTVYRATLVERMGLERRLSEPTRMIIRHLERRPVKSLLSVIGIAAATGIIMISNFQQDSVDYMIDIQYGLSQREDLAVMFVEPTSRRSLYSLRSMVGVDHAEGYRAVPVRLRFEHRSYRTSLDGVDPDGELQRILNADLERVDLPTEGVVLTDYLARILGVQPGDDLTVEVLEGNQPVFEISVIAVAKQYLGVQAYMQRQALNRLLKEGPAISGAYLAADSQNRDRLYAELKGMPRVTGTVIRESAIEQFNEMMEESILFFALITALLGACVAFGVVYNSARIALSERGRELASLRVLGFTRGEIAYILLGELGLLTLIALPLGFLFGAALSGYLANAIQSDLYRVPLVIKPDTYALASVVILLSLAISAGMIWRRLGRLDLVAVLKTRE